MSSETTSRVSSPMFDANIFADLHKLETEVNEHFATNSTAIDTLRGVLKEINQRLDSIHDTHDTLASSCNESMEISNRRLASLHKALELIKDELGQQGKFYDEYYDEFTQFQSGFKRDLHRLERENDANAKTYSELSQRAGQFDECLSEHSAQLEAIKKHTCDLQTTLARDNNTLRELCEARDAVTRELSEVRGELNDYDQSQELAEIEFRMDALEDSTKQRLEWVQQALGAAGVYGVTTHDLASESAIAIATVPNRIPSCEGFGVNQDRQLYSASMADYHLQSELEDLRKDLESLSRDVECVRSQFQAAEQYEGLTQTKPRGQKITEVVMSISQQFWSMLQSALSRLPTVHLSVSRAARQASQQMSG